jgi:hypothetical protein
LEVEQGPIRRFCQAVVEKIDKGDGEWAIGMHRDFGEGGGSGEEFAAFVLFALFSSGLGLCFLDLAAKFNFLLAKGFELGF